jgi:hypothetical protein
MPALSILVDSYHKRHKKIRQVFCSGIKEGRQYELERLLSSLVLLNYFLKAALQVIVDVINAQTNARDAHCKVARLQPSSESPAIH